MELKGVIVYLLLAATISFLSTTESADVLRLPTESVKPPNEECCINVGNCYYEGYFVTACYCLDLYTECPSSWCDKCQQLFPPPPYASSLYLCNDLRPGFYNNTCS